MSRALLICYRIFAVPYVLFGLLLIVDTNFIAGRDQTAKLRSKHVELTRSHGGLDAVIALFHPRDYVLVYDDGSKESVSDALYTLVEPKDLIDSAPSKVFETSHRIYIMRPPQRVIVYDSDLPVFLNFFALALISPLMFFFFKPAANPKVWKSLGEPPAWAFIAIFFVVFGLVAIGVDIWAIVRLLRH